jgi:uncharacterized protein YjdB/subtilisin-like proprotein convertase family protein
MKRFYLLTLLCFLSIAGFAQVVALSPTGDGGFETGTDLASNGWTSVNVPTNRWFVGTPAGPFAGARCAFVSNNSGTSWSYTNSAASLSHFYRDIAIPTGATSITLTFYYKSNGEGGNWDQLLVYHAPTTVTPAGTPTGTTTAMAGATLILATPAIGAAPPWTLMTFTIPNTYAGSSVRLIFTWKNDGLFGTDPPAAVDNIQLTYIPACTPPAVTTGVLTVCPTSSTVLSNATVGGTWLSTNTAVATLTASGGTATVTGIAAGTANISYTAAGCARVVTLTVNPAPIASVTPTTATACNGAGSLISANGSVPGSLTLSSGAIGVVVPDGTGAAALSSLTASSIPAGATITGISVNFNMNHTWVGDMRINLRSPNGQILNLFNQVGGSADNFINTTISSTGVTALGAAPFTGTFAASAALTGATGYTATTTSWAALYPAPYSGAWDLVMSDHAGGDQGTLTSWSITFTYVSPPSFTWAPLGAIFTDAGLTTPYTGGAAASVYVAPTAATTYTASASFGGCTTNVTSVRNVLPLPVPITGVATVCEGRTTTLINTDGGGTWTSSNLAVATINSATGLVDAGVAGTALITYTFTSTGCRRTRVLTVNPTPPNITGTAGFCKGTTSDLDNTDVGGTWFSTETAVATVDPAGVVNGVTEGFSTISYTNSIGCVTSRQVTINPLPSLAVSPTTNVTICATETASFTASSPNPSFTLLSQDFNGTLGSWNITNTSGNAASYWQIVPSGSNGVIGDGTPMLQSASILAVPTPTNTAITSPSFSTMGGYGTVTLSFNQYAISDGTASAAIEYSLNGGPFQPWVNQTDTTLGTDPFSAATPNFTMTLPAAAVGVPDVRLRWVYNATVVYWFIDNITVKGTLPTPTYAWTGTIGLSCSTCASVNITPAAVGSNVYSVVVTSVHGCNTGSPVTVSVNPLPATISGALSVCEGNFSTLTSTAGGTWSSSDPSKGSIDATSGVLAGVASGTTTISYTLPTGCLTTRVATVVAAPSATLGTASVCVGLTTSLSNATSGGTWSSSAPSVATVSTFGVVTGISAGNTNISYTLPTGCSIFREVTVNPLPVAIVGTQTVCKGLSTTFTSATTGGVWTSSNTTVASIDASTGEIAGLNTGNATMTYTLPTSCIAIRGVTVNPLPAAISGVNAICQGASTIMTNATSGGTWSLSSGIASINATSGLVTSGAFTGNVTVSYILNTTGCYTVHPLTINEVPANITGTMDVCKGNTTLLTSTTPGGSWTSGATGTLSIDASTGIATGVNAGTANVTYTLPTTCRTTANVTVNPLPGFTFGNSEVCVGLTVTLTNGTSGGAWSSSDLTVATVAPDGTVTGIAAGSANIMYTLSTGCARSFTIVVNPLPSDITGVFNVCPGTTALVTNSDAGGAWSSSNTAVASINSGGTVTGIAAGNVLITYTLPTTCITTKEVTVNPLPNNSTGASSVCTGLTTIFSNTTPGGVWSTTDATKADVTPAGVVSGIAPGTAGIVYTLPATGCARTKTIVVNRTPDPIFGVAEACPGFTSQLSSSPTNGTWVSGSSNAIISAGGLVTAVSAGNAEITYTLPEGCRATQTFVVHPLPAAITGNRNVCIGSTTLLENASSGGTWTSANSAIGTIDVNTGTVGGIAQGTTTITYTLPTTCSRTAVVTVNPLPNPIFGTLNVCQASFVTLTNSTPGGTWSSNAPAIAPISAAGVVTGAAQGTAVISYILPTSCRSVASMVVNPRPADITGATTVCALESSVLSSATTGGVWSSSADGIAAVDASGLVSGNAAGNAIISYTLPTGCRKMAMFIVNQLPGAISGNLNICQGNTSALGNNVSGGSWESSNSTVAPITVTGAVTGMAEGSSIITYTLPTGCKRTATVVINPLPEPITGSLEICAGLTSSLSSASPGGTWNTSTMVALISNSGLVTAIAAGTTTVSYTIGNNCRRTAIFTVNALPALIGGPTSVCPGLTAILTNANPLGTWSSDNAGVASIGGTSGVVSGVSEGSANVTYTLPTGCQRSRSITVHPAVAPIAGTNTVCNGEMSTLTNASTGGVWTSGNTAVAPIDALTGTFTGVAAGSARVTYTLPTGCRTSGFVLVNPLPGNINGEMSVCAGSTVTLGNTTSGGSWTSSDDGVAMIDASGIVTGVVPGGAIITYSLGTGCSKTRSIVVNPVPMVVNVTGGGAYCADGTGVNIGLDTTENGTNYTLVNGSVFTTATGTGDEISFGMQTMTGAYTATATNTFGCSSPMAGSAEVTVNPVVVPTIAMSSDKGSRVCEGTLVTYTSAATNGGTTPAYSWIVNGTAVGAATSYAFIPANGDVVSVKLTSSAACAAPASVSDALTMTVVPKFTPAVSIIVAPNDTVCQGSTAVFYATGVNGGDEPVYTWIVGGSIVTGVTGPMHTFIPTNGQTVICRLNSSYECPSVNDVQSNTINMRVDTKFVPAVSIIAQQGLIVEQGQKVDFTTVVTNAGPAPRYQWMINGNIIVGATTTAFTYSDFNDGDSVTCVVYGSAPCGLATINSVVMKVVPFTAVTNTGLANSDIRLVPNPNTGVFAITGSLATTADEFITIEIADMLGQIVYTSRVQVRNNMINERIQLNNELANGMYLLNISNGADRKAFHFVLKH